MHVIWKRPDGLYGADPSDFAVVKIGNHSKIWLHKRDHSNFPFRIAGGWQEEEASIRLNNLVNLLDKPDSEWLNSLNKIFNDHLQDDASKFINELGRWVEDLRLHLKGDTWELEIMQETFTELSNKLKSIKASFLTSSK
jgi:hypothetical protein